MTVSVLQCIDTGVIVISDFNMTDHCDSSRNDGVSGFKVDHGNKILKFNEFSRACISVEVIYAVKLSIIDVFKFVRKLRKRYNGMGK